MEPRDIFVFRWSLAILTVVCGFSRAQVEFARTAADLAKRIEDGAANIGVLVDIDLESYLQTAFNKSVVPFVIQPTTKSITGYCNPGGLISAGLGNTACTIWTPRNLFSIFSTSLLLSNLNLKISPTYSADRQFFNDWTQVDLLAAEKSSIWLSRVSFNGTGNTEDLYHTGLSARQSAVYAERCGFHGFAAAHGAAASLVQSSSLVLYNSMMTTNRAGIWLPSDLAVESDSLKTLVYPFMKNHISSRVMITQSDFVANRKRQFIPLAASPDGDVVAFDSTIIYKDSMSEVNVNLTCGGGTSCGEGSMATFQPLSCSSKAPVNFLIGNESFVRDTQQELPASIDGPDSHNVRLMPWVGADCPDVTPQARVMPKSRERANRIEWIVIVSIGGSAAALAIIGQTVAFMQSWLNWCCFSLCAARKDMYEP